MSKLSAIARSALYMLLQFIITPPYAILTLACFPLSPHKLNREMPTRAAAGRGEFPLSALGEGAEFGRRTPG